MAIDWHSGIGRTTAPPQVSATLGDTVLWTWGDAGQHNVISGSPREGAGEAETGRVFASGQPARLSSFIWIVAGVQPGEIIPFFCVPHPWMRGSIFVADARETVDTSRPTTTTSPATTSSTLAPRVRLSFPLVPLTGFSALFAGSGGEDSAAPSLRFSSVTWPGAAVFDMIQSELEDAAAFQGSCGRRCISGVHCRALYVRTSEPGSTLLRCTGLKTLGMLAGEPEAMRIQSASLARMRGYDDQSDGDGQPCMPAETTAATHPPTVPTSTVAPATTTDDGLLPPIGPTAPAVRHTVRWESTVGNPEPAAHTMAAVGDTIRFVWSDGALHNVISGLFGELNAGIRFHSGPLEDSGVFDWVVTGEVGEIIPYFCEIHPWMYGEVKIVPPRPPPPFFPAWNLVGIVTRAGATRASMQNAVQLCLGEGMTLPPPNAPLAIATAMASALHHGVGNQVWLNAIWRPERRGWYSWAGLPVLELSGNSLPLVATTDRALCLAAHGGRLGGTQPGIFAVPCVVRHAVVCVPAGSTTTATTLPPSPETWTTADTDIAGSGYSGSGYDAADGSGDDDSGSANDSDEGFANDSDKGSGYDADKGSGDDADNDIALLESRLTSAAPKTTESTLVHLPCQEAITWPPLL